MSGDEHAPELVPVDPAWRALHTLHYQLLASQQHMLLDAQRTGAYHRGITRNTRDFAGKTVLDVGAGSGILSLFAAQAGARKVYAVEENSPACARTLAAANGLEGRVEVLQSRLEDLVLPEKVDVIVSEPWGFFLFHERMVEAFLVARDRFLAPGGRLFPGSGRLSIAPFSDAELYAARTSALSFWSQADFYGVDLRAMASRAADEIFSMPALGYVAPGSLVASPAVQAFDFERLPLAALAEIVLPFSFVAERSEFVHGLAGWFEVAFEGTTERVVLSTAPDALETHWSQLRFVLIEPLDMREGQTLRGALTLRANQHSSYTATLEAELEGEGAIFPQTFRMEHYFPVDEVL
jgi:histone-arginine methyltransferase CARM1